MLSQLLEDKGAQKLTLEEKLSVIDRIWKIDQLEHRMGKGLAGSRFDDEGDEE